MFVKAILRLRRTRHSTLSWRNPFRHVRVVNPTTAKQESMMAAAMSRLDHEVGFQTSPGRTEFAYHAGQAPNSCQELTVSVQVGR